MRFPAVAAVRAREEAPAKAATVELAVVVPPPGAQVVLVASSASRSRGIRLGLAAVSLSTVVASLLVGV